MAKYDAGKKYRWEHSDVFQISGDDFGLFLNAFRSILDTPEAKRIMMAERASEAIETLMAKYVEKGIIKEVSEQPKMEVKRNVKD